MKLYGYWRSSSAWRVRIALAHKNLSVEHVPIHLVKAGGEQRRPDFLAKNPGAQVPVLELDTNPVRYLTQSVAIIEYLDEVYPTPALYPTDPIARAQTRTLVETVNSGIQPFHNVGFVTQMQALVPSFASPLWFGQILPRGLAALESLAQGSARAFLIGDQLSAADVFLVPQMYAARRFGIPLEPYPTLRRVEEHCLSLPAFSATHPSQQPDAEPQC